jgi:SAM-dependent methyltransferase
MARETWTHEWKDDLELAGAWESAAPEWIRWAREPGHDSYWRYHRDRFLELLPPPPLTVLDLGCGEGRLSRDLKRLGYDVSGVDASPTLIAAAQENDPDGRYRVATAEATGLDDASFDMVVAFMALHDVDPLDPAVGEVARVLRPEGRLCMAVVHPLNSAGTFENTDAGAPFVLDGPYMQERRYVSTGGRDDLSMRFASAHRPFESYFISLERQGFLTERVREIVDGDPSPKLRPGQRYRGVPLFLHIRAVKPHDS